MDKRKEEARELLTTRYVLFSCEGKAERVIITKLLEAGLTIVPDRFIVRDKDGCLCTSYRGAKDIQREYLQVDYPDGLTVARIVDTNPDRFSFDRPYRLRDIKILDFITQPEIERLVLVKEKALGAFLQRGKSERQLNASDWCIQRLHMPDIKSENFLRSYWSNEDELVWCIREASGTLSGKKKELLGLNDLLK